VQLYYSNERLLNTALPRDDQSEFRAVVNLGQAIERVPNSVNQDAFVLFDAERLREWDELIGVPRFVPPKIRADIVESLILAPLGNQDDPFEGELCGSAGGQSLLPGQRT
jgi:hypothetical protein